MRYFILLCYFLVACTEVLIADKITADELLKRGTGSKCTFPFFLIPFLKAIYWSLEQISRETIVQLQRSLRHVTKKVNEVAFGNLSAILALVKSKLAYGGIWIVGTFVAATYLVDKIRVSVHLRLTNVIVHTCRQGVVEILVKFWLPITTDLVL